MTPEEHYRISVVFCPACERVRPAGDIEFVELVAELGNIPRFHCKICGSTFEMLPPDGFPSRAAGM